MLKFNEKPKQKDIDDEIEKVKKVKEKDKERELETITEQIATLTIRKQEIEREIENGITIADGNIGNGLLRERQPVG